MFGKNSKMGKQAKKTKMTKTTSVEASNEAKGCGRHCSSNKTGNSAKNCK